MIAIVVTTTMLTATAAHASSAELDLQFGSGMGYVISGADTFYLDSIVAPDGGIIVVGKMNDFPTVFKFRSVGSLDSTFNASGTPGYLIMGTVYEGAFMSVELHPDGTIVTVGSVRDPGVDAQAVAVKITQQGTLDTSFATGGIYELPDSSYDELFTDLAINSAGVIYAVGHISNSGTNVGIILALTSVGTVEPSFHSGTILSANAGTTYENIEINSQDQLIVAGSIAGSPHSGMLFQRYSSGGVVDTTFGSNGITSISVEGTTTVSGMYVDSAGIAFVGSSEYGQTMSGVYGRLDLSGNLDPTFVSNSPTPGVSQFPLYFNIQAISRQDDGKYVFTGSVERQLNTYSATSRVSEAGVLDSSFNEESTSLGTFIFTESTLTQFNSFGLVHSDGGWVILGTDFSGQSSQGALYKIARETTPSPTPALANTGAQDVVWLVPTSGLIALIVGVLMLARRKRLK